MDIRKIPRLQGSFFLSRIDIFFEIFNFVKQKVVMKIFQKVLNHLIDKQSLGTTNKDNESP